MEIGIGVDFNPTENDKLVLQEWNAIYEEWLDSGNENKFHFVDGPPFVSSQNLHLGHILISLMKSTTLYYQRMCGQGVLNKKGFDVHGLPIEMAVNKLLGITTGKDVLAMGIDKYNAFCKETILKYSDAWKPIFDRIGRMTSDDHYKTMDPSFMESCWWVFKQLWEKGLVKKGIRVMSYSIPCATPLSNFEAGQNYKSIEDMSIYVAFPLLDEISCVDYDTLPFVPDEDGNPTKMIHIVAWTTTPWTLPSNMALCVNRDADYILIYAKKLNKILLIGKNTLFKIFPDYLHPENGDVNFDYQILDLFKGHLLVGVQYKPPFLYDDAQHEHRIFEDDFVQSYSYEKDKSPGSGVVHLAPGFGEDDFRVCQKNGITQLFVPMDENGCMTSSPKNMPNLTGIFYSKCNQTIITNLEERGLIIKKELYSHDYPFCWRTDTPLVYKAMDVWFIAATKIRDQMIENNKKINWYPEHVGKGRFHNWLENTIDWCVSRNRYFGTPMPIWQSADGEYLVVGSIAELAHLSGVDAAGITDLHMEHVDKIVIHKDGKIFKRIEAVFDCWFESGCVPFGQIHYPFAAGTADFFDKKDALCDFICEGIDQTRGWFYTLHVISTALFNKPAFKNVVCAGLVLGSDGRKYSKRHDNFTNPLAIVDEHGADLLRLYMLQLSATRADSSRFKETDIRVETRPITQWQNSIKFLLEHVCVYENTTGKPFPKDAAATAASCDGGNDSDRWIISRLNTCVGNVRALMSQFNYAKCIAEMYSFIEDFTNWYLKFNRSRIKGKETHDDWVHSLTTCVYVVHQFNLVMAPLTPFLSHTILKNLQRCGLYNGSAKSALLERFPSVDIQRVNEQSERRFQLFQTVADAVRTLRNQAGLASVKKPIKSVRVYLEATDDLEAMRDYVLNDEMNVLNLSINPILSAHNVSISMAPSYGKIYRGDYPKIKAALELLQFPNNIDEQQLSQIEMEGHAIPFKHLKLEKKISIPVSDQELMLERDGCYVILDKTQDEEVRMGHFIRMMVCNTQRLRKQKGVRPWDQISFYFSTFSESTQNQWLIQNKLDLEQRLGYPVFLEPQANEFELCQSVFELDDAIQIHCIIYQKK